VPAPEFSRRVPADRTVNRWSAVLAERRRAGLAILDLTESNPTRVGLPSLLAALPPPITSHPAARYEPDPRGLPAAREAVAAYYAARGARVSAEDVVLTTGTSESLAHLLRLLADPGGVLASPEPGYPLFAPIAAAEGVGSVAYRLAYDGHWHLDRDSVVRALAAGPRALASVEPHLPAGTRLADSDWEFLAESAERAGVPLIVDEVFADYPWDGAGFPSRAADARGLTFVLSGLSKVCGLPQLKLGWIVIAGPEPLKARARAGLEWLADLFLSVASPVQHALPHLLARRDEFQRPLRERLRANRDGVDAWARAHPAAGRLAAEGGWVCVLRLPSARDDERWALDLLERGVAAHPGHFYDLAGGSHVVPSLIVEPRVLAEGLARLGEMLTDG